MPRMQLSTPPATATAAIAVPVAAAAPAVDSSASDKRKRDVEAFTHEQHLLVFWTAHVWKAAGRNTAQLPNCALELMQAVSTRPKKRTTQEVNVATNRAEKMLSSMDAQKFESELVAACDLADATFAGTALEDWRQLCSTTKAGDTMRLPPSKATRSAEQEQSEQAMAAAVLEKMALSEAEAHDAQQRELSKAHNRECAPSHPSFHPLPHALLPWLTLTHNPNPATGFRRS